MDKIEIILDEVLKELEVGIVNAEIRYLLKIHQNTSSHFERIPCFNIKDKNKLVLKIKEYISLFNNSNEQLYADSEESFIKRKIVLLFADMSINDFNDPVLYVDRRINFYNTPLFEDKIIENVDSLESNIEIKIKKYDKETPYGFASIIYDDTNSYILPTISYGISDDICYIYAIQDYNKHEKNPYYNKIKRKLYKLNDKVLDSETDEYKQYKNRQSSYYPENISDVSPGALLALTIFLNEIEKHGIYKVRVISYLPVRYDNKVRSIAKKCLKEGKLKNLSKDEIRKNYLNLIDEQRKIQSNITEKLIRTFFRVAHHFENVIISSLPMELDDKLNINLTKFEYSDNEILNEVINKSNSKII